jgi:hypothetical protein
LVNGADEPGGDILRGDALNVKPGRKGYHEGNTGSVPEQEVNEIMKLRRAKDRIRYAAFRQRAVSRELSLVIRERYTINADDGDIYKMSNANVARRFG